MKRLNKLERYTAYCILLHEIETGGYYYVCNAFSFIFGKRGQHFDSLDYLPEFKNKKPKSSGLAFWGITKIGMRKRINALKECIEETHP